jgi:NitT/TauT family transport system substrate-binding protein
MKFLRFALAVIVGLGMLAGRSDLAHAQTLTKISIASPSSDDATPAVYAASAGIFKKYGLDVDVQRLANGSAIAAAVLGGSITFGLNNTASISIAHAHGVPLQIVAPGGLYTGDDAVLLIVSKNSSIHSARDLAGKVAGSPSVRDMASLSTMAWIDQHGGDSASLKVVEIPSPSITAALSEGRIDMATLQVPSLSEALSSGTVRSIGRPYTGISSHFLLSAWIASTDTIAHSPDVVKRFIAALQEASRYTDAHHAETVAAMSAFSGVDASVIASGVRSNPPQYVDPMMLQPLVDRAAQYKFIDRSFDAKDMISPLALPQK